MRRCLHSERDIPAWMGRTTRRLTKVSPSLRRSDDRRRMDSATSVTANTTARWNLPPLILHPFSGGGSTDELLEGSQAALALQGFTSADATEAELRLRVLNGRYQEIRMLLFLGKDLFRWMQQCVDYARRADGPDCGVTEQSFSALLVECPPGNVATKLETWGVTDRRAVF